MTADEWRALGELRQVGEQRLFCVDTGGDKPVLAILHGYPTSSYDYCKVLPALAARFRVVVHDHPGFGFSDKPLDYSYSLVDQADRAVALWRSLGIRDAHVLAHDYGTSVATELLARRQFGSEPVSIRSLTLCNGSMHIELAHPRLIQRLLCSRVTGPLVARLSSRRTIARNLRAVYHRPERLSAEEIDAVWTMMTFNDGRRVLPAITQYLRERVRYWHRWIGALQATDLPVNVLWARNDPVAVVAMAAVLHEEIPDSRLRLLDDLGHFPMLEDPERWTSALLAMLEDR